ncbi:MAG: hypothetical protein ACR2NZ_15015 [Rubripirellula sp.]
MKYFYLHPSDLVWLKGWLTKHAAFLLIAGSLWAAFHSWPSQQPNQANANESAVRELNVSRESSALAEPGDHSDVSIHSVPPEGWRHTKDGWEHVSTWRPAPRPLGEIVREQEEREPKWVKSTLAGVRGIPPLAFGLFQITAIAVIVNVSRKRSDGGTQI